MHDLPSLVGREAPDGPRVLSVCSSVGGKDLGFARAGFRTVGLCEWDPWRRRVLNRHWPGVPVHPDLDGLAEWAERDPDAVREWCGGQPDVLIGGTPCQDLSSAGRRAGLYDSTRSSLFVSFIRLRNALGIEWTVWENVAGALTSNGGLDFMAVLGAFVGAPVAFPSGRVEWAAGDGDGGGDEPGLQRHVRPHGVARAGVVAGPWGGACWRLLDAQHFGVPQRRHRVFVVGRLGGECPPEILLESQGVRRHPGAGGEAGEAPPWAPPRRAHGAVAADDLGQRVAGALGVNGVGRGHRTDLDGSDAYVAPAVAGALTHKPRDRGEATDNIVVPTIPGSYEKGVGHNRDGLVVDHRVPPARANGQPQGRRERADADEVGGAVGDGPRWAA